MERYKSANLQQGKVTVPQTVSAPAQGAQAASSVATRGLQDLSSRLAAFSSAAFERAAVEASEKAVTQAQKDDSSGAAFHKQSVHTAYGKAYNNARTASYTANAEIELDRKSTEYALQFKNDPDGYAKSMQEYYKQMQSEAPIPELKSVIGITGKKIANQTFGKLMVGAMKESQDAQLDDYGRAIELKTGQLINAYSRGDNATAELIKDSMFTYTGTMQFEGLIDQATAQKIERNVEYEVTKGTISNAVRDLVEDGNLADAGTIIESFSSEIPENMSIEEAENITQEITQIFNNGVKVHKAGLKTVAKQANNEVKDAVSVMKSGKVPKKPVSEETLSASSEENQNKYYVQKEVSKILNKYSGFTIEEQEKLVTEYKATEEGSKISVEVMKQLEKTIQERRTAWRKDPISQGAAEGLYEPTEVLQVGMSEEQLGEILIQRHEQSQINISEAGDGASALLTQDEAVKWTNAIHSADETQQLAMMDQVNSLPSEIGKEIYKQIGKKGAYTFRRVGELISTDLPAARKILFGSKVDVPAPIGFKGQAISAASDLMTLATADSMNNYVEAATNYAKGHLAQTGEEVSGKEAMEAVYGTIGEFSGGKFFIPKGVSEEDFGVFIDGYEVPGHPKLTEDIRSMNDFWDDSDLQLKSAGDGKYLVYDPSDDAYIHVGGKPLEIEYGN